MGQVYRRSGNGDNLWLGGSARLLVYIGLGEKEKGGGLWLLGFMCEMFAP